MKLIIISPGILPVPSVEGGAVETLIDLYIDYNEAHLDNELLVFSSYSDAAANKAKEYSKVKFEFINQNTLKFKTKRLFWGIINKISKKYFGNAYVRTIGSILKKNYDMNEFDYIIIENKPEYSMLFSKKFNQKIILHQHNDFLNENTKNYSKIMKSLTAAIVVSDFVNRRIQTINFKNIKIETLYNGINLSLFKKDSCVDLSENIRFGFIGRFVPEKGVKELILSFNKLSREFSSVKLDIIGGNSNGIDDSFITECKKIAADNISFKGFVKNDELSNCYNFIDVLVVPSVIDDACPLTVIEGIVSGKPIIASNSGGIPELFDETNGILVDRNNLVEELYLAMKKLISNPKLIDEMSKNSLKKSDRFKSDSFCKKFYEIIENCNI